MRQEERRLQELLRPKEKTSFHPATMFFFEKGQLVLKRHRQFSKLDPKASGPYRIEDISGLYGQRISIRRADGKGLKTVWHASKLIPYEEPYQEPNEIDLGDYDVP